MKEKKVVKTEAEWRDQLTPEQFEICRKRGTEPPFSGIYWDCEDEGMYRCVCCGLELFHSGKKFDSGCGWPSFFDAVDPDRIKKNLDLSHGMRRTEVTCARCDAHLGHVFDDGPKPTGLRFCINSVAVNLDRETQS